MATTNAITPRGELRRLTVLPPAGRRPVDRESALRQVRDARRHVQSRAERFAHLKRQYD